MASTQIAQIYGSKFSSEPTILAHQVIDIVENLQLFCLQHGIDQFNEKDKVILVVQISLLLKNYVVDSMNDFSLETVGLTWTFKIRRNLVLNIMFLEDEHYNHILTAAVYSYEPQIQLTIPES